MTDDHRAREIVFYVNGKRKLVHHPDPRTRLLDYLRSNDVGLTGTKNVCGQGGCGACTVTLHRYNARSQAVENLAINSCLRPLCAMDGMAITTIEGVGSVATSISPVQHRLIVENGSQCGYCTPGWVMSMHSYLVGHPGERLDQLQVEQLFDGNLCRCTGYRSILYAMRHFAADFGTKDEERCMACFLDPALAPKVLSAEPNEVPPEIMCPPRELCLEREGYTWHRPLTLDALLAILAEHHEPGDLRLVVGNTSVGIYGEPEIGVTLGPPWVRVDISHVPELYGLSVGGDTLTIGAATTYTGLLEWLTGLLPSSPEHQRSALDALHYMAKRTAGRIVRDAASVAGNTMLVVHHVRSGTPFPSDLFTALSALGAEVEVLCPGWQSARRLPLLDFAHRFQRDAALQAGAVILRYHVPLTRSGEWARTFKVALRKVNAHSIVNGGFRIALDAQRRVTRAGAVLGGLGPIAFHVEELETWLMERIWDAETLAGGLKVLRASVKAQLDATRERMRDVPDEGFTEDYRTHLAETYFYEFFVWLAERLEPGKVSPEVRSAGLRHSRPLSHGTQRFRTYPSEHPVSQPLVKVEGFLQATGEAGYTHDLGLPARGLDGALVVSTCPRAPSFTFAIPEKGGPSRTAAPAELASYLRERFPGFVDLVTAADIPGKNEQQLVGPPDPLLCPAGSGVSACGQGLAVVLADSPREAVDVAWFVQTQCVIYGRAEADAAPVLDFEEAIERKLFLDDASLVRPGSSFEWVNEVEAVIDGVHCRITRGSQGSMSPQIHFYFETQSALASPGERGPRSMRVQSSTQNPSGVALAVKDALGLSSNQVEVEIQRLGGGYGGKDARSPWCSAIAAVAAAKVKRPVRLNLTRETDSAFIGHSNPLLGSYTIALGSGNDDPGNQGRIMGFVTDFWLNAGNTADASPAIMDTVVLRSDSSYFVPNCRTTATICLTNTISNTAFRSLEAISGILIREDAIEAAAYELGMRAEEVRAKNLYRMGDLTPYGQRLDYCYLRELWSYTRRSWPEVRGRETFDDRVAAIDAWNARNRWRKRGISMVPVTYGMGWRLASKERGDALVDIYTDGGVLVRHGGVEMGQGLNTQITQLVANALNVPLQMIQIGTTSTGVIPNPTSTGACTGTAFNGGAVQIACQRLRKRLEQLCLAALRERGPRYCAEQHIDFWSYDDGWRHPVVTEATKGAPVTLPMWCHVVTLATQERVNLSTQAQYNEEGGSAPDTGLAFSAPHTVQQFNGFSFSAAISEVDVDVLTGEVTVVRSDIVYDMGKSLNPATDVGQIEGAFMHGLGRVLTENLVYQAAPPGMGMNNTPNTWGYKVPATTSLPLELNVNLFPRDEAAQVPDNPNLLMSAKESGEPPMCLAVTVYFAVKHAILAARHDRGVTGWFRLDLPCTVQRVREACLVDASDLTLGEAQIQNGCAQV